MNRGKNPLATAKCDAVIAVGSGTINDVCKYGGARPNPAVFAPPLMNGYTSVNAAITVHGHKMSLAAQAPVGAFFASVSWLRPRPHDPPGLRQPLPTTGADWLLSTLVRPPIDAP
jgi:glycerol-1-phosphate dehydrogenase [NAD(P)+]